MIQSWRMFRTVVLGLIAVLPLCFVTPIQADTAVAKQKLRVVVFGGHPDDPESGAGGLVAMLTRAGHEVICAYGTSFRGDRKINGEPEGVVRRREATAACKLLNATPKFFDYAHEKLFADGPTLEAKLGKYGEAGQRGAAILRRIREMCVDYGGYLQEMSQEASAQ